MKDNNLGNEMTAAQFETMKQFINQQSIQIAALNGALDAVIQKLPASTRNWILGEIARSKIIWPLDLSGDLPFPESNLSAEDQLIQFSKTLKWNQQNKTFIHH